MWGHSKEMDSYVLVFQHEGLTTQLPTPPDLPTKTPWFCLQTLALFMAKTFRLLG